jgi:hypothetical protein
MSEDALIVMTSAIKTAFILSRLWAQRGLRGPSQVSTLAAVARTADLETVHHPRGTGGVASSSDV